MKHAAHPDFWSAYRDLRPEIQQLADKCFEMLKCNSRHPSLQLKKVGEYWSARVGIHHRALAIEVKNGLLWTWIGTHEDYVRLIRS